MHPGASSRRSISRVPSLNGRHATTSARPRCAGSRPTRRSVLINGKRRHTSALVNLNGSDRPRLGLDRLQRHPDSPTIEQHRGPARRRLRRNTAPTRSPVSSTSFSVKDIGWGLDRLGYGATRPRATVADLKLDAFAGTELGDRAARSSSPASTCATTARREPHPARHAPAVFRRQRHDRRLDGDLGQLRLGHGPFRVERHFGSARGHRSTASTTASAIPAPRSRACGSTASCRSATGLSFYFFGGGSIKHSEGAGFFRRPGDDRTVRAIWPNGFLPVIQAKVADYSLGGGLKGKAGGWAWDLSTVYGSNVLNYVTAESETRPSARRARPASTTVSSPSTNGPRISNSPMSSTSGSRRR